jgi:hypothetical protein
MDSLKFTVALWILLKVNGVRIPSKPSFKMATLLLKFFNKLILISQAQQTTVGRGARAEKAYPSYNTDKFHMLIYEVC